MPGSPREAATCHGRGRSVACDLGERVTHDRDVGWIDAVDEHLSHELDVRRQDTGE